MSSKNLTTRNRILEACKELLENEASPDVRMSDIAKRAGISRQALYLHFPNRAELLVATARYLDEIHGIGAVFDRKVMGSAGVARLTALIDTWGRYIPKIYGVGKALMAMKDTDAEARAAWDDRMQAVRALYQEAVKSLVEAGVLNAELDPKTAVDLLWTLGSVRNWEQLTQECGWSQSKYLTHLKRTSLQVVGA